MRNYLLVDIHGRSHRGMLIDAEHANISRGYRSQVVSNNVWECATSPLLAVMINPLHAECVVPRMYELRGKVEDNQFILHRVHEVTVPQVSPEQKLAFSMLCVESLTSNPVFSSWANGWLENRDRSISGMKLIRRQLQDSAEQGDTSLKALTKIGARANEINRLYESEFDFLRRACDVVNAAAALITKPRQWQLTLAEMVATATSNILDEKKRLQFAKLAVQTIPTENSRRQMSKPKLLRRRRDDDRAGTPDPQIFTENNRGVSNIKDRISARPKGKTN